MGNTFPGLGSLLVQLVSCKLIRFSPLLPFAGLVGQLCLVLFCDLQVCVMDRAEVRSPLYSPASLHAWHLSMLCMYMTNHFVPGKMSDFFSPPESHSVPCRLIWDIKTLWIFNQTGCNCHSPNFSGWHLPPCSALLLVLLAAACGN